MKQENLQQLADIYNSLLQIHTRGEETLVMADCMRALFNIINDEAKEAQSKKNEEA